jgi:hypothetical protein
MHIGQQVPGATDASANLILSKVLEALGFDLHILLVEVKLTLVSDCQRLPIFPFRPPVSTEDRAAL